MSESGGTASAPPPPQPTLHDGDVTLRPWQPDDATRSPAWDGQSTGQDDDERGVVVFAIEHRGEIAGSVDVTKQGDGVGNLSWEVSPAHRGHHVATRAVRLLIDYSFASLALVRVQTAVEVGNLGALRTAGRAGLRREGVARSAGTTGGTRLDVVWLARLSTDPPPHTPASFRGVLNAALPMKHVITQGLIRSDTGKVLLCELTYKREWDLPGGIVDPGESPAQALARELHEEVGLALPNLGLLLVNWLPPWRGWDDAVLFVFDLGAHHESLAEGLTLEPREIRGLHWCTPDEAAGRVAPYLANLLPALLSGPATPSYLEAGSSLDDGSGPS